MSKDDCVAIECEKSCVMTSPNYCKVVLYMKSYKYDGCCYHSCIKCGCDQLVINMRRQDALCLIKMNVARFVEDDEEIECTPCGSCCDRENVLLAA